MSKRPEFRDNPYGVHVMNPAQMGGPFTLCGMAFYAYGTVAGETPLLTSEANKVTCEMCARLIRSFCNPAITAEPAKGGEG